MFRQSIAAILIATSLMLSGCASVPMASQGMDAQAKQFTTTTDQASLYIYRNETFGSAIKMPLLIDGVTVGDTVSKSYVYNMLPPGKHVIVSKTEKDVSLSIDMEAGHTYFVWQEVKMGAFAARSDLHLVDEAKGRAGVNQCKLIQAP